jgi:hypothetical protein
VQVKVTPLQTKPWLQNAVEQSSPFFDVGWQVPHMAPFGILQNVDWH